MERLLSVLDIMEHYQLKCRQTATKRMREMDSLVTVGRKLFVPESSVKRYDERNTTHPPALIRAAMRRKRQRA